MTATRTASAGKQGPSVRSDCFIQIESIGGTEVTITLKTKVESMYGASLRTALSDLAAHFGLQGVAITCEDAGALPFVLAARFEAAVKRAFPENTKEYLPEMLNAPRPETSRDRLRRSRLYLPGNEPKFFVNAGLHNPDGVILDLEDSVAPAEKDAAALLVRNALRSVNFYGCERMVRINQLPKGLDDLQYIVPNDIDVILVPKCESAQQIHDIEKEINRLRKKHKTSRPVYLMPIIESALGVLKAYDIAAASPLNCALAVGLEDYTADIGAERTLEGRESFFARSMVINAAKAAGIQAIDTVFSDVADMEGLRQSVLEAKSLGFEGKGCIHPRQIEVIHQAFAPTQKEIDKALAIQKAFDDATAKGLGVVSLGSKMIDPPVVKRAMNTLRLAELNGLLPAEHTESEVQP